MTPYRNLIRPTFLPVAAPGTEVKHYAAGRMILTSIRLVDFTLNTGDNGQLRIGRSLMSVRAPFEFVPQTVAVDITFHHSDAAAHSATPGYGIGSVVASGAGNTITGTAVDVMTSANASNLNGGVNKRAATLASPVITDAVFLNLAATWPDVTTTLMAVRGTIHINWLALGPQ